MRTQPQPYKDLPLTEAIAQGFNVVQPKFTGQWSRCCVGNGNAVFHSDSGAVIRTIPTPTILTTTHTLIGNILLPLRSAPSAPPLFVVFDCWEMDGMDMTNFSYRDRFGVAKIAVEVLRDYPFDHVINYPITKAEELWSHLDERHCGIVYRKSFDKANAVVGVARKYSSLPGALP